MKKIICILLFIVLSLGYVFINEYNENSNEYTETIILDTENIKSYEYIKIGDDKESVISKIGLPDRKDLSEYGFTWYVYNRFKNNFIMVGIENEKVVGLYSNSLNSCETKGIKIGDKLVDVREKYKPIEYKKKGNIKFVVESKNQFDILLEDDKYITLFYDIHNNSKVRSYQIIDKNIENKTSDIYPVFNEQLKYSFEMQTIDLINSERDKNDLDRLTFSEKAKISSEKHSEDMKENNYFDHLNKENETPFDRMKKEDIIYSIAGENIAAGQINSVYAHEALMNSLGHRRNILGDYENVGVGVSFGGHYKIYYTQNFYSR
ncbi:Ca-chelating serine protease [[Clostridium] sordellii]|uniref:Ca++-chelating serine protease,SCP-like extracellular domain protein n=1 Tax=Paraclostridium sordellii TaxID=1505 RepID=A0ABP1XPP7_PARSO|nr:CAP-associated domain-containing protein [Paeniclostridium sordellii]CEJ73335.1 putative Ca++-chelating serine protease,SCP-like extracellular domain protein [[Clostridium] sordellii] [Paeniclostridium sordellii]CEN68888.1 Ca-chelating serine protease [[Clostridium] sordellii] [Paeniclostridium sordellii]CEN72155.1 Ca-chelating serine protease [[Clostridium] sordellii] [Paeniclostridium sordellii]CEO23253.1 Ca-chelating serine protease [[Clostridium] sordellii] [Paeniclostridium sordellii]C